MNPVKKILLVQLYSNGDCLYATAIAKQIKKDHPGCQLTWAISSFCSKIIANNPDVDAIVEIDNVAKNDVSAFRKFKRKIGLWKKEGIYDEIFITHNADTNQAYYDGSIRSSILKAYPGKLTVPVTPVLKLYDSEMLNAKQFAEKHALATYRNVVLFEYAPQSGQSNMTTAMAIQLAETLAAKGDTAVILSSANKIDHHLPAVIDGSRMTLRETAALTHYCSFLLGSSSGITWISTSEASKQLPMVQLLNADAPWVNPISRDFERFGLPVNSVIELIQYEPGMIISCVTMALNDFNAARKQFNQPVPLHFKTTRRIVYNLLIYLEFGAILKHIRVNREMYGDNLSFYLAVLTGFVTSPFKLIKNLVTKKATRFRKIYQ